MLVSLRHRGPDEVGYYFDDVIAMGTVRLSIVDVREGQQPIGDASRRYWICFNGEIYNYRELRDELLSLGCLFSTHSDTEVLLHAWIVWGPGALGKLNGAFAFCIYDRRQGTLLLARDRFGKRPLYYVQHREQLLFGSELKSLLAWDDFDFELDGEQLASIFRTWTPIEDQTGYRNVKQVPAGCYLSVSRSALRVVNYEALQLDGTDVAMSEAEAIEQVRDTVRNSVRRRLSGDVDIGVYLSGGLDSAIIAQLVAETKPGVTHSFSVEFDNAEFDESSDQQLLARHCGTEHARLRISNADIARTFPSALWHAEVPVFRTAFVPMFLLSQMVNSRGMKVVMTGEGADEAFLGYDIFKETLLRSAWSELSGEQRRERLSRMYPYLRQFNADNLTSLQAFFDRFNRGGEPGELFSHEVRFHNSSLSSRLLAGKYDDLKPLSAAVGAALESYAPLSRVQRAQWLEFKTLLSGYLLSTQGDRMSLAHSVENRCPFLDPEVVRLGAATNLKFSDGYDEKYLLKRAFADQLPERVLSKPKQPYRAPDASAFLEARPDYLELLRSERELKKIELLDARFCQAFVDRIVAKPIAQISQAENQTFLFLLSVVLLHDQFVRRNGPVPGDLETLLVRQIDGRVLK